MDNFKQASKSKLRFITTRGALSVEQLWDLSLKDLDALAVSLETQYKLSGKKSFLVAKSRKDKEIKLMFDITLEILTTKVEENAETREALAAKEHNSKIDSLIAEKLDEELKGKSVKQLKAMRK